MIKQGDRIRCVEASTNLTHGKVYAALSHEYSSNGGKLVRVRRDDGMVFGLLTLRFVPLGSRYKNYKLKELYDLI